MKRCSACGRSARKRRRAYVLTLGAIRPGQICPACERLAWLLVLGPDAPATDTPRSVARKARAVRRVLEAYETTIGARRQVDWAPGKAAELELERRRVVEAHTHKRGPRGKS